MSRIATLTLYLVVLLPGAGIAQSKNERTVSYDFQAGRENTHGSLRG